MKCKQSITYAGVLIVALSGQVALASQWSPDLAERVYRLPPEQMERVIERDFGRSELARSIRESAEELEDSQSKIVSLQTQLDSGNFQGEMALELRHQEVIAKKEYLDTLREKIKSEKDQLVTKKRFLQGLADQTRREKFRNRTQQEISSLRQDAKNRVDSAPIDVTAFKASGHKNNQMREEYSQNLEAIRSLQSAIANHSMNLSSQPQSGNREDQINQLLENVDMELSAVAMREEMLTHMVKLLSLDAMQLAQDVEMFNLDSDGNTQVSQGDAMPNVQLFLSQR